MTGAPASLAGMTVDERPAAPGLAARWTKAGTRGAVSGLLQRAARPGARRVAGISLDDPGARGL